MQLQIRRQLASGLFFVLFGALTLWLGADMAVGTAADMGVGYVPRMLALGCVGVGLWQLGVGLMHGRGEVAILNLRPIAFVIASIAGFAFVLPYAGLPLTVLLLVLAAAFSGEIHDRSRMLLTALILAAGSALLFGILLQLQIPLLPAMMRP